MSACPCKGCKDRWVTETSICHIYCDRYKEWYEINVVQRRKKYARSEADIVLLNTYNKLKRRFGK